MRFVDRYQFLRNESLWGRIYDLEHIENQDYEIQQKIKNLKLKKAEVEKRLVNIMMRNVRIQ